MAMMGHNGLEPFAIDRIGVFGLSFLLEHIESNEPEYTMGSLAKMATDLWHKQSPIVPNARDLYRINRADCYL